MFPHTVEETSTAVQIVNAICANTAEAKHEHNIGLGIPAWGLNRKLNATRTLHSITPNTDPALEYTTLSISLAPHSISWEFLDEDGRIRKSGTLKTSTPKADFVEIVSAYGSGKLFMNI